MIHFGNYSLFCHGWINKCENISCLSFINYIEQLIKMITNSSAKEIYEELIFTNWCMVAQFKFEI